MTTLDLIIEDPVGLHARPISVLINAIKEYEAEISLLHEEKKANAKSMISVLQLGAHHGARVTLTIDGPESEAALETLQALFANELKQEFSVMSVG
jgi:phosphotransferase system HPr (HPr) family protein